MFILRLGQRTSKTFLAMYQISRIWQLQKCQLISTMPLVRGITDTYTAHLLMLPVSQQPRAGRSCALILISNLPPYFRIPNILSTFNWQIGRPRRLINISASHSKCSGFKSPPGIGYPDIFLGTPQSFLAYARIVPKIRLRSLLSTPFPSHPLIILILDTI
jgi:hypothetical protein